jgi:hypothetical protein
MESPHVTLICNLITKELKSMIDRVAKGEGLDADTLAEKYLEKPKKQRPAKVVVKTETCSATTAKGKPCSLKPLEGKCVCRIHDKTTPKPVKEKAVKVTKPKKLKKTQPEHTHELDGVDHADCELCQSHGSPLAETDDDEDFEMVSSPVKNLGERLAKIAMYDEEEED